MKKQLTKQDGFGFIELLVVMSIFSVALASMLTMNLQTQQQVARATDLEKVLAVRDSAAGLIMDGQSWFMTSYYGAPGMVQLSGLPAFDTASFPYAIPQQIAPPYVAGVPYGTLLDIRNAAGTVFINSTNPFVGIDTKGRTCPDPTNPLDTNVFSEAVPTPRCPFRWEARWFVSTNASNPLIYVTLTLKVSPGTIPMNPAAHSLDFTSGQPLMRTLFNSWKSLGQAYANPPTNSVQADKWWYVSFSGVPGCAFTYPGEMCAQPAGSYCLCSGACSGNNGTVQVYRCQ